MAFTSTNDTFPNLTYRFSKVSIGEGIGISTQQLTSFEKEIHEFQIEEVLFDTTTCYQIDEEIIGSEAYFKVSTYQLDPSKDPKAYIQLEQKDIDDIYECINIVHDFICSYNPFFLIPNHFGKPIQFICELLNGEKAAITVGRFYRNSEGQERHAPFPSTWKSLFKYDYTHDPEHQNSEIISLTFFDDADTIDTNTVPLILL